MAISAVCTINTATATPGVARAVTCTITNSGGADVTVTSIVPVICPTGALNRHVSAVLGKPDSGPGSNVTVPAGSTLAKTWQVRAFEPTAGTSLAEPSSFVYDCGANIRTSDGSQTVATVVVLTVSSPTH